MKRIAAFLVLALLTACVQPDLDTDASDAADTAPDRLASGVVCRVGPAGGPMVADRGIGGTGAPMGNQATFKEADRGIGGTGIVGVITGFASICVNGIEVRYDKSAVVDIDGSAATVSALRAGQVVVIQAQGPKGTPVAQTISVRREIAGRVESVELDSGTLTIAGQQVSVPSGTWGANNVRLGDWVAVSGLRRASGSIVASRLDRAPAGEFIIRGPIVRDSAGVRVGSLVLQGAAAAKLSNGQFVTVSGHYVGARAQARAVTSDALFPNPAEFFGSPVSHLIIQAFVRVANGAVWVNGLKVNADPGVHAKAGPDRIAIVSLERKADGTYAAVALRYAGYRGMAAGAANGTGVAARGDTSLPRGRPAAGSIAAPADEIGAGPPASEPVAPVSAPAGTDPVDPPVSATPSAETSPAIVAWTEPKQKTAADGPAIESPSPGPTAPHIPLTSQLISGNPSAGTITVASRTPLSRIGAIVRSHSALNPVLVSSSTSPPTVSLATEAITSGTSPAAVENAVPNPGPNDPATTANDPRMVGTSSGHGSAAGDNPSSGH
jgi:Domain of unknown function (DUF5666)